jgi:hypothetical protein
MYKAIQNDVLKDFGPNGGPMCEIPPLKEAPPVDEHGGINSLCRHISQLTNENFYNSVVVNLMLQHLSKRH